MNFPPPSETEVLAYFSNRLYHRVPDDHVYGAFCPLHNDLVKSLLISFEDGRWTCATCGSGGLLEFEQ